MRASKILTDDEVKYTYPYKLARKIWAKFKILDPKENGDKWDKLLIVFKDALSDLPPESEILLPFSREQYVDKYLKSYEKYCDTVKSALLELPAEVHQRNYIVFCDGAYRQYLNRC